jgi:hypothetical protein
MHIATHTITRHKDGSSKVMFVKGREYTDAQLDALPNWYKEYTIKSI